MLKTKKSLRNIKGVMKITLKILVACEESQTVTKELRILGYEAYSCDILECSGGHPEWHLQQDVVPLLQQGWDIIIAFPPCTHLAVSGSRYFKQKIADGRQQQGIDFFMEFVNASCEHIVIENPVGIMSSKWRKPDQIINPFQFGHSEAKKTCLWLKGLPKLQPTDILKLPLCGHWDNQTKEKQNKLLIDGVWIGWNDKRTARLRSKTYTGIARAMAEQWTASLCPNVSK
jgi:site-specific DNA-cytosine methylase